MTKTKSQTIDLTQFEGHTPGPWKAGFRALDIWAPSEKGGEAKIFDVRGWGYLTGKGDGALGLTEDQAIAIQTANANLAAAAPDLLAAYKAVLARAEAAERQSREAFPAGAEAMREASATVCDDKFDKTGIVEVLQAARAIRALPIPAQEK